MRCHVWDRQRLLNPEHLVVLSAGRISHNSIHLLIITTDFVALHWFTGYVVFIITSFLADVESRDQCLLSPKVLSCFLGVIMSIRSFFLLHYIKLDYTTLHYITLQLYLKKTHTSKVGPRRVHKEIYNKNQTKNISTMKLQGNFKAS